MVGTKEGEVVLMDVAGGGVKTTGEDGGEGSGHSGAVWSLDLRQDGGALATGSADGTVKFWEFDGNGGVDLSLVHTRTLQMNDEVMCVKYSYSDDSAARLVCVATMDNTVRVFFEDSLKFFLSLYGHTLPALAIDCSDDDALCASAGADKTIKIWGLDFGDTHKTLYGHTDSITVLKFVRKTHNFFTGSKDKTIRYWDADRFDQILLLTGHTGEVTGLDIPNTGAFILSTGMDRQIRVWERTRDMVFVEEERERELERMQDAQVVEAGRRASLKTASVGAEDDDADNIIDPDGPQSEAAVRKSVISVSAGDRVAEAVELADSEMKAVARRMTTQAADKKVTPNPMLLGKDPDRYVLWVLRTVKASELEQSLLILPLAIVERLIYYLILLLRKRLGVELCAKVAIFLMNTHQNQIVANRSFAGPIAELGRLIHSRLAELRDALGINISAMKMIGSLAKARKDAFNTSEKPTDVWAGLGLGSNQAALLQSNKRKKM